MKVKVTLLVTVTHTPMVAVALQVTVEVTQFLAQGHSGSRLGWSWS